MANDSLLYNNNYWDEKLGPEFRKNNFRRRCPSFCAHMAALNDDILNTQIKTDNLGTSVGNR